LASAGFVVLRFDLSGIGDSRPRTGGLPFEDGVIRDIKDAMDFLTGARRADRFILMGLCAGADRALRMACGDERVTGLALMDPYALPTPGYYFHRYVRRLLNVQSWRRFITGNSRLWNILKGVAERALRPRVAETSNAGGAASPEERIIAGLRALARRRVEMFFIYSGDGPAYYNYRVRLKPDMDALDFDGKLRLSLLEDSDHTFTLLESQEWLVDSVHDWTLKARARERSEPVGGGL
jgi:pimeloyl-ACP methyl ester carboxylesterase